MSSLTEDQGPAEARDAEPGADLPDAYVIPTALAQATLDYLASRPYREVYALVQAFEVLEPVKPQASTLADA